MNQKKKLIISIISILAVVLVVAGVTYAIFAITTNSGIVQGNSGKLDVNYTISNANLTGTMMPSTSRSDNLKETVTAKLNSGSVAGKFNIYLTPTTITGLPKEAINWEVDAIDSSSNLLDHYAGNLSSSTVNSPVTIVDGYDLSTTNVTFNIYVWLNGELLTNSNFSDTNSFVATISADSVPITGTFTEPITVTFDAGGGSGATSTKTVQNGEPYGLLPTPTKEGYTFLGWNGKNLLNLGVSQSFPSNLAGSNSTIRTFSFDTYIVGMASNNYYYPNNVRSYDLGIGTLSVNASSGYGVSFPLQLSSGTNYYFKCKSDDSDLAVPRITYYTADGTYLSYQTSTKSGNTFYKQFSLPNTAYYTLIVFASASTETKSFYDIQLEEGSAATAYEPYYITSDTEVVRDSNHTLTAIWKENS